MLSDMTNGTQKRRCSAGFLMNETILFCAYKPAFHMIWAQSNTCQVNFISIHPSRPINSIIWGRSSITRGLSLHRAVSWIAITLTNDDVTERSHLVMTLHNRNSHLDAYFMCLNFKHKGSRVHSQIWTHLIQAATCALKGRRDLILLCCKSYLLLQHKAQSIISKWLLLGNLIENYYWATSADGRAPKILLPQGGPLIYHV